MTVTEDGQAEIVRSFGSLVMGPTLPNAYRIEEFDPSVAPEERDSDQDNPMGGSVGGWDVDGKREIYCRVTLTAWPDDEMQCVLDKEALENFWQPGSDVAALVWQEGTLQRQRFGRCRGVDVKNRKMTYKDLTCKFDALNPRAYAVAPNQYLATDGDVVVNDGSRRTQAWKVTIAGPFPSGTLIYELETGGATNNLLIPAVDDGDVLVIDALLGQALVTTTLTGVARAITGDITTDGWPSRFLSLPSGNSQFTLTGGDMDIEVLSCFS